MDDTKAGVAVFVKTKLREGDEWKEGHAFGGHFDSIGATLGYLQYLENRNTGFYIQIGFVGWKKD